MKCPFCNQEDTIVKDSRACNNNENIRRRRYCGKCHAKFSTLEKPIRKELYVIKRSGAKRIFEMQKIYDSINMALRKRNASDQLVETIVNKICMSLYSSNEREIPTRKIGDMILDELARIDEVAYIRFASVYKDFMTARDFSRFINMIKVSTK
ncbi:MAG: transcriptional regulator NrdR [Rickettsiaceae bacterium]|nr:transcriptional regulator NrdR [Rickettsiaceae bacterium]